MKNNVYTLILLSLMISGCILKENVNDDEQSVWQDTENQLKVLVNAVEEVRKNDTTGKLVYPRSLTPDGSLKMVPSSDWCSGFFPGCLWYMYEKTKKDYWLNYAKKYTSALVDQQWNGRTHDMGFKMYCSFGNGYRLKHDPSYRNILIQSAKTLSSRFNKKVGCIRSWDHHKNKWQFPVIIDNMMNLELLFWATRETGDSTFYNIAVSHALTTMKNHFRDDYSSFHVLDYDTLTGTVLQKNTHQGYADNSAWARGQAWALYGYTMVYRETKEKRFLFQAEHVANFILTHPNLPDDLVPYWDFDAPNIPDEPRDVSAAAIAASALFELSSFVNKESKKKYYDVADCIVNTLTTKYRPDPSADQGYLLDHSTGSKPHGSEIDMPLIYADYYYIEAMLRKKYYANSN